MEYFPWCGSGSALRSYEIGDYSDRAGLEVDWEDK